MSNPSLPRLLLVEDDPVSRAFLGNALRALPAEVDSADSMAAARSLADAQEYALWLFDARLPDGDGIDLLSRLRARHPHVPAIAHTASDETATLDALRAAGFVDVLVKPLPATAVQAAVRRTLGLNVSQPASTALWDDDAAATALNGSRDNVRALRELFLAELPKVRERITAAAGRDDLDGMRDDLHRLRASCGFVGAAQLGVAAQALQEQPQSAEAMTRFKQVAEATLEQAGQAARI